jgi:DNA-binding transcriptional LysR family regulator
MTLEQLRIFVEAAHHGSFTLAAASLGITQSAISISIRKLEEKHEVVLFNRVGNGLSLTEPGQILLNEARRILADVDLTVKRIETYQNAPKRRILVACSRNAYDHWMPAIAAHLLERNDLPQLELTVGKADDITAWVMRGTVDFGVSENTPGHSTLRYWSVFEDCLRLYAGAELAARVSDQHAWPVLESIAPILWECDGDLEPFVLTEFDKHRLHERRLRHSNMRFQSLLAVCDAMLTGKHAGYMTTKLAAKIMGFSQLRALPHFDIPVRYWLFGSQQGLGENLAAAIREEVVKVCQG